MSEGGLKTSDTSNVNKSVQLHTSAVNVALLAFAAEHRVTARAV